MSAVIGGLTVLQLASLLEALAGTALTTAKLVQMIQQHSAAHPDDVLRLRADSPVATGYLDQVLQMEESSGA